MKREISLRRKWAYVFYALTIVAAILIGYVPDWPMPTFTFLLPFFIANGLNYSDRKSEADKKTGILIIGAGISIIVIAFVLIVLLL